jgi:3-hydroxyisobutyrate dehydrogenase-like beta-hydroxyacid dehydrogenase
MGGGMAANLLKAGYQLTVWNRNPEKCEPFARKGAREQPDDTLRPIFTEADNLLRQAGGDSEARAIGPVLLLTAADVPAMPPQSRGQR